MESLSEFSTPDIDKERAEHERTYKHFKCEYCNAEFMTKQENSAHRWECMHFVCEVCGKDFRTPEERERFKNSDFYSKIKCKFMQSSR